MINLKNILITTVSCLFCLSSFGQTYHMPGEDMEHEGTWLQWPHNDLYGPYYQDDIEAGWVKMVKTLESGEKVHIIAKDNAHKTSITNKLTIANVPMTNIDFKMYPTDDVWVRDNGPVFVYDQNDNLTILDWGFNGWGFDTPYAKCDIIPNSISTDLGIPRIDLSAMVLEGGSLEHDGNGTMIATRSCITHPSRNPNLTETQIENYMTNYMGITKFIWLDGVYGQDITDHHADGFIKFANDSTIITMDSLDLDYWLLTGQEINLVHDATNTSNEPFNVVIVPLTQSTVKSTLGTDLGIKGSYCNYYIGNESILVPIYNDPNDTIALNIIQGVYPNRTVVGINVQNLYEYGGMTHCVTQQQPISLNSSSTNNAIDLNDKMSTNLSPNPCTDFINITLQVKQTTIIHCTILSMEGKVLTKKITKTLFQGSNKLKVDTKGLASGVYNCLLESSKGEAQLIKFIIE
jgi:agmatine deiminase